MIRGTRIGGKRAIVVASAGDSGALYGTFHLLRLLSDGDADRSGSTCASKPRHQRAACSTTGTTSTASIERGYAGRSLWKWDELPATIDPRLHDYARANASIGINGTVINSVNANPQVADAPTTSPRPRPSPTCSGPYGIRVYLSANFAAPRMIGGLADRRSARSRRSQQWWKDKADEIYKAHPRLRRLRRQGQQRGPARAAGLQAHARRRRQRAGRRGRAARRHRHVARLRLRRRRSIPIASSAPTWSSCRSTASSAPTCSCR